MEKFLSSETEREQRQGQKQKKTLLLPFIQIVKHLGTSL